MVRALLQLHVFQVLQHGLPLPDHVLNVLVLLDVILVFEVELGLDLHHAFAPLRAVLQRVHLPHLLW